MLVNPVVANTSTAGQLLAYHIIQCVSIKHVSACKNALMPQCEIRISPFATSRKTRAWAGTRECKRGGSRSAGGASCPAGHASTSVKGFMESNGNV